MNTTSRPAPARHTGTAMRRTVPAPGAAAARRLADDFFVMVHDEGNRRLTGRILGLGLAAALLGELALLDAVGIQDQVLRARAAPPAGDRLIAGIYSRVRSGPVRPVRDWLDFAALTAVEDVSARLLAEGRIERTPPVLRLPGRAGRWRPTDSGRATWPAVRLNMQVHAGTEDPYPLMLFALTGITGLNHPSLYSVMGLLRDPGAMARILAPLAAAVPILPELLEHTRTAVASAVVTRHG